MAAPIARAKAHHTVQLSAPTSRSSSVEPDWPAPCSAPCCGPSCRGWSASPCSASTSRSSCPAVADGTCPAVPAAGLPARQGSERLRSSNRRESAGSAKDSAMLTESARLKWSCAAREKPGGCNLGAPNRSWSQGRSSTAVQASCHGMVPPSMDAAGANVRISPATPLMALTSSGGVSLKPRMSGRHGKAAAFASDSKAAAAVGVEAAVASGSRPNDSSSAAVNWEGGRDAATSPLRTTTRRSAWCMYWI
mmetsp:Transcript_66452/g.214155  ORF Transcript_66452/g.214155 Transcript_66452/m.214155 type:complete len:250 (-) Transcript_66452:343-1092(-)